MPTAPGALCADCPKRATKGRYCDDHQETNASIENRRASDAHRRENDPFRHLYKTARWAHIRLAVLYRRPLCCWCKHKASTVVDHIVKAKDYVAQHGGGVEWFFDVENLQGLCKRCHDIKTRRGG